MNQLPTPLSQTFFARDTHVVARALLGKILVRQWRGTLLTGKITEVESYVGEDDQASHAARGRTARTEIMYGPAGRAYIYLIYGMYHCLNVVTETEGFPAAILIRSLDTVTGPGRLTRALHITRAQNDVDLTRHGNLYLAESGTRIRPSHIGTSPRIGVAYAGEDAELPWRYFIRNA